MVQLFGSTTGHGEAQRDAIKQIQWEIAVQVAQLGRDVVLDWGFWSRAEREDYRARAAALGLRTELRFLDVPLAELIHRLEWRIRDLRPTSFPVSETELRQWWGTFEPPTADELEP